MSTKFLADVGDRSPGDQGPVPRVRPGRLDAWEAVHLLLGADVDEATNFLACDMLICTLTAIGAPRGAGSREVRA